MWQWCANVKIILLIVCVYESLITIAFCFNLIEPYFYVYAIKCIFYKLIHRFFNTRLFV